MRIDERIKDNIAVLTISGSMMGGRETCCLSDKVKSLLADGIKKIVIDLHHVRWINSPGLGILIGCWSLVAQANGELKIANATDKVNNLLVMTHLIEFFGNYESVPRAVASYSAGNLSQH
jgi:anti-sigma B factor antagonist